ncbi:MAG: beta-Ala-His dipeptidase [Candidatus Paceibacterota bacterium]
MINAKIIEGLTPERFWRHLSQIAEIPRGSGNESGVREYVISIAQQNGLNFKTDKIGNLVVIHGATEGMENLPSVALQGHMDMVCEKNASVIHDFLKDPICFAREGNIMKAVGTTAGFDNGVGVAAMCMLMEDELPHGAREYLFTVEEESGLDGAKGLEKDFIASGILINLDTEEEGRIYIGCSGGKNTKGMMPLATEPVPAGHTAIALTVSGLSGGHSGCDIHENRGNAIKLLAQALSSIHAETDARLSHISGGGKHNAIPREAEAHIHIPVDQVELAKHLVHDVADQLKKEYGETESVLSVELALMDAEEGLETHVFKPELQTALLEVLMALPHGVHKMSESVPGLVETSSNLASVKHENDEIAIVTSQRSSDHSGLLEISEAVKNAFECGNFAIEHSEGYPGWNPDIHSPLLKTAVGVYESQFGATPEVKAVHAGLECGIIGEKFPGIQMLSIGPTVKNPHSPDELLEIDTIPKFLKFLAALLAEIQ